MKHKIVLAVGLLLAGSALGLAQDMLRVTVLTGEFNVGMGDKLDTSKGMALRPGGYVEAPAKMHHYAWIGNGEAIVQVTGPGPFGITYVDPADDPSKK